MNNESLIDVLRKIRLNFEFVFSDETIWKKLIDNADTENFVDLVRVVRNLWDTVNKYIEANNAIIENHEGRIADLEAWKIEVDATLEVIQNTLTNLESRLSTAESTIATHTSQISSINGKVDAIDDRIDAIDATIVEINNDIDDLIAKVATNTADIAWLKEQVQSSVSIAQVVELTGNPADLATTIKTNLVAAINELSGKIDTLTSRLDGIDGKIGDLDNLVTQDKSNLVAAINEAYNHGGGGGASSASDVSYDNTDSGMEATNVQAAIDELHKDIYGSESGPTYAEYETDTIVDIAVADLSDIPNVVSTPWNGMKALVGHSADDLKVYQYNGSTSSWESNSYYGIGFEKPTRIIYNYNVAYRDPSDYSVLSHALDDRLNIKFDAKMGMPSGNITGGFSLYDTDADNLGWYELIGDYPSIGNYGFGGETSGTNYPFVAYPNVTNPEWGAKAYVSYIGDKLAVGKYFYVKKYYQFNPFAIKTQDAKVTITGIGSDTLGTYISSYTVEDINVSTPGIVRVDGVTIEKDANGVLKLAQAYQDIIRGLQTDLDAAVVRINNLENRTIARVEASDADALSASLSNTNAVFGVEETQE